MSLLKNLLVVVAATGAMGSAQAQNTFTPGTLSPAIQTQTDIFGTGSFADIFNFTIDASRQAVSSSTTPLAALELFPGFNAPGTPLYTGLYLNADVLTPGDFFARISGTARALDGGLRFSVVANPEPAEGMMLLAGLVLVAFMARRKASLMTAD